MNKKPLITLLFGLLVLILAACVPFTRVVGNATPPGPAATPQVVAIGAAIRDAQVTSVEVQITGSDPAQANAIVRGNLTESCATLIEPQVSYGGNSFNITVLMSSPADKGCVQVITPFEQTIPLDIANLAPGTYTLVANGASAVFTLPSESAQPINSFELVYYDSDHNIQIVSPSFPADIVLNPYFNGLLPQGGSANGMAYVLDTTNETKAVAVDGNRVGTLSFIGRPTTYGLAVFPGNADSLPRLAWGTEYTQKYPNSTLQISALDGSGMETLLTQEVSEPLTTLVAEFWSADGKTLYFSKEPVGIGGYILFGGASNLYKIDIDTKEVSEVTPVNPSDEEPQVCLDSISSDYRYVAEHCAQNFIRIRDLSTGGVAKIQTPAEIDSGHQFAGSARFSPDGSRIAFAVAEGDPTSEQGWVVVSDTAASNARVILTSQEGSYYTVAGWLNDETLLVQSTSLQDCSPYCAAELWSINLDGTAPQKVADGSFITFIPNARIASPQPPVEPAPTVTDCQDAAEYISDDGLDGATYAPNSAFMKTWTVKNTGTCSWNSEYLVFQISGAFMTQQPGYQIIPPGETVEPGQTVDIIVGMTSPPLKGIYKSYWGIKNEDGEIMQIEGGTNGNSFYVDINVNSGTGNTGAVTATAIDIVPEQGSGDACTANSTYLVHAYISTDGPTSVSYEIGSSAGQVSAGYFELNGEKAPYVEGLLQFDKADDRKIDMRFIGPYPYPDDISINLRVNGGEWVSTKLYCP